MILVALAIALFVDNILGMLWYSEMLFGSSWIQLTYPGKRAADMKANPVVYLATNIGHLIVATTIFFITRVLMKVTDLAGAIRIASWLCALVWGSQIPHSVFSGRPSRLFLIDHGYDAVCIFLTTAIITMLA